jgi:alcohol dehydrogenase (NADP+)
MLDFCGERNIACDIERTPIQEIGQAYERFLKGNVKYRFVIDMATLKAEAWAKSANAATVTRRLPDEPQEPG